MGGILAQGYAVLWTDNDVVWRANPVQVLPQVGNPNEVSSLPSDPRARERGGVPPVAGGAPGGAPGVDGCARRPENLGVLRDPIRRSGTGRVKRRGCLGLGVWCWARGPTWGRRVDPSPLGRRNFGGVVCCPLGSSARRVFRDASREPAMARSTEHHHVGHYTDPPARWL